MVVGENKRSNIMDGIENTGDVRLHDHRLRLKQRFDIVRKLGQGTYGKVQLGINKKTGQEVAIKTIKKCKIESEADLIRIRREVQIMSSVRHPNIVHIYEVFENSEKMILVMEYCSGGELYDYLSQKKVLQEDEARRLFRQIATAVYYCHIHKICHRDLKLENVLLDDTGSAKIADFGLSNVFKETSLLSTFCGSPLYASPEIVKGTPYIGPEVDCWSLGVLLYTLVYGAMPFDGSNFKRLVRQISNGDYYEPKNPSTASPLIRDMLTVDPLKRADIAYICDHSWVNAGCEVSCLEISEALAAETPVRLDLLLSLAPAAPSNSVVVPDERTLGAEESGTDLTTSASMATVEPSNSAEKRILDLVAEGGEDAIKPSPTRTIVSAGDNKRKLELAMSASGMQRKKERAASAASVAGAGALPEEVPKAPESPPETAEPSTPEAVQPCLVSSATMTISPAPAAAAELTKDLTREIIKETSPEEPKTLNARVTAKKMSPTKAEEKLPEKSESGDKPAVAAAAEKLTALALAPAPAAHKPKKLSIPGGNVGSFKEQFERRASLTATPEVKRNVSKPVVSKIAKPKAQSEDREINSKSPDNGTVRLQQIGIEPSPAPAEEMIRGGVKKTESEPSHSTPVDASVILQDARRSLQNSMAKLVEEKVGEENRRRAARDIITTAIRTGKPPVPYGRSASAGVASLPSPPAAAAPAAPAPPAPRVFRTEAQHRVEDHRARGVSVERVIPIHVAEEAPAAAPPKTASAPAPARPAHQPLRRLTSTESNASAAESCSSGEPIKKSAREFIIPIAVEGKGYVTPRQRSLEPEPARRARVARPRRISSLVSGGESEEEDDNHMHRLRSSRAARAESVSSGEEDEEDEGFHLLTAENLFSTLLHRVRALTNRLNGEEGPGFPQHPHSLFNNLHQSPFFNSPHLPRRNLLREGWGSRDLHADFDSMFNKSRQSMPRGNNKKTDKQQSENSNSEDTEDGAETELDLSGIQLSEREARALSGLTPALARRLQRQLLAQLPPAAARQLRRTLSLHAPAPRARSAAPAPASPPPSAPDPSAPAFSTLPRLGRPPDRDAQPEPQRAGVRGAPERPLLSKYLAPERALAPDEPRSPDGSLVSEPSYAAAYGGRRLSLRAAEPPRKRVSRFLRPDFFDAPPDENPYARQKREKELETQKILREIREKKNRALDSPSLRSPTDYGDVQQMFRDEPVLARKCVSPSILLSKERSRSNTPFYPILDNIKETTLDISQKVVDTDIGTDTGDRKQKTNFDDINLNIDSKLTRPKSFPVKNLGHDDGNQNILSVNTPGVEVDNKEKTLPRESKLIRPKSYPTSSPSPEKVYISRNSKKGEPVSNNSLQEKTPPPPEGNNDVEVSFSISLPKKIKAAAIITTESLIEPSIKYEDQQSDNQDANLVLKKYVVSCSKNSAETTNAEDQRVEHGVNVSNGNLNGNVIKEDSKFKILSSSSKKDITQKPYEMDGNGKKVTTKKKIIKKVSSKSKADEASSDSKDVRPTTEKKKVTKKMKERDSENSAKTNFTKKKSVLQSIGHKLEKFASSKSNSPEKVCDTKTSVSDIKKENGNFNRTNREQSVPVNPEPPTESNLIKRAVTITDVATLDSQTPAPSKTTVSKVLGLFKKFEPKEKVVKPLEKTVFESDKSSTVLDIKSEPLNGPADDKPKRPTSLLLNGLSRKNKYEKPTNEGVTTNSIENNDPPALKKETESKNIKSSLKLDFSRLPRVKKIVPTEPVIVPRMMNVSPIDKENEQKEKSEKNCIIPENGCDTVDTQSRSRSRSRSTFSNSEAKSDLSGEVKDSLQEGNARTPLRNHEPTTPEREDIVERIRRKSFYSRFNEKKQRRRSNLVGPGAAEYDPLAVLHAERELSPASDLSPCADRYRSLITDLPVSARNNSRFDSYGLNDKIDTYRSLDRAEFRKYPGSRSYLDYDPPGSYGTLGHRYSRTKSLLDGCDGTEEASLASLREPHKYNRTFSMYSPGSYATYRPKKTRNSAIILKESEKEPSPENILERIRQRKNISISVTRKPDPEKEFLPRSTLPPKGEGDGAECSEKVD